jgi:malate dehydrogenase (oxaloacetate-decarboxylating)
MNSEKEELAKISNLTGKKGHLNEIMDGADVFVGVSVGNVLKKEWVMKMNEKPIIFALANPDPEILPDDAK